jgi:hypothetical protein
MEGAGSLRFGTSAGDSYINGAMYQNQIPQDAQLAFYLSYEPIQVASGLLQEGLIWILWVLIGIFLYIIPGWALLGLLWPGWGKLHWGEKLGLSAGVSLAIYPIIFLWTHLIGLNLGRLYAWIPPIVGMLIIIWNNRKDLKNRSISSPIPLSPFPWIDITLLLVIGLVFAVRFWVIRGLDAPLWGDSYQHTMIAQLLVDNNGLFNSWEPYAELSTFTYHFGYHTLVAGFHWITNLVLLQATLWTGQIINGLAVLALFPLATKVGKNRWAGIICILIAGLLSPMPMYYVNWSRYTQLAGQAILPVVIFMIWYFLEENTLSWRILITIWIVLAGIALTHYRVLIFALLFILSIFIISINNPPLIRRILKYSLYAGIGAGLIFLPWLINVADGLYLTMFRILATTPATQISTFAQQTNTIGNISLYLPELLWILLIISIGWGLWRQDRAILLIGLWWFLIILASNPNWIKLPGAGIISNFTVLIGFYIPAGIFIGAAGGWIIKSIITISKDQNPESDSNGLIKSWHINLTFAILISLMGLWGVWQRRGDLHASAHTLVTHPDKLAYAWVSNNTPDNSTILVNSFFAFDDSVIVGSDGGWWLPLLSKRKTSLPPINYVAEQGPNPEYRLWINELTANIMSFGIQDAGVLKMLKERGFTHIYTGQRQGTINSPFPLLNPSDLILSENFNLIYQQDRVWIFEIVY